jgi:hypothetical protein
MKENNMEWFWKFLTAAAAAFTRVWAYFAFFPTAAPV